MSIGSLDFGGFDIIVILIVLMATLFGLARGFLKEVSSLIALISGVVLALFAFGQFREKAQATISPPQLADGVLIVGGFIIGYIIVFFVLRGFARSVQGKEPGAIDRLLGGAFGFAKGTLACALFVLIFTASNREAAELEDYRQSGVLTPEAIENMPEPLKELLNDEPKPLPEWLTGATLYPPLNTISGKLQELPFAKAKDFAERLKDGEFKDKFFTTEGDSDE